MNIDVLFKPRSLRIKDIKGPLCPMEEIVYATSTS